MSLPAATTETTTCPVCGGGLPANVPFRQCPRCLLDLGLARGGEGSKALDVSFLDAPAPRSPDEGFDYELIEQIGRGGMGVVYRAHQRSLNRTVAIKMIAVGDFASPAALARFRREAETAAKLDHPNIVAIIEVGERQANPFLVMRLVEGASVAARLPQLALASDAKGANARQAQLGIARLLAIVARAVDYAHSRGVLHRDLKPSNILLDLEGNPHLTDFGIAKCVDQETGLTQTAELLGTLTYMAPEQAAGAAISRLADIYSLGAILYELLTARRLFEGTKMDVLRQVIENDPIQPRLINPAIDQDLETICQKCLDKDPARRYVSALQFAEDLDRWQRREPILARQAGPITRLRRWTMRNPTVASLLITLSLGMAVTLGLLARANDEKFRKSIALDILRTESSRQLQEVWESPKPFFEIKSETLSTMAGMELSGLTEAEHRFTIAMVAEGTPLDRALRAAPTFDQLERFISRSEETPTRLDLRLYKKNPSVIDDLVNGAIDFAQINAREFLRARALDPKIRPLARVLPYAGFNDNVVIFTRNESGIRSLSELRGKSFLMTPAESTLSFWAKVKLVEAGIRASDFSSYRYVDRAAVGNALSSMTPVEAVLAGTYDAAVVREKRFMEVARERNLTALLRFEDTGDLVVASGKLPEATATAFQLALLAVDQSHASQPLVDSPTRFRAVSENDFNDMASKLEAEAAFEQ